MEIDIVLEFHFISFCFVSVSLSEVFVGIDLLK